MGLPAERPGLGGLGAAPTASRGGQGGRPCVRGCPRRGRHPTRSCSHRRRRTRQLDRWAVGRGEGQLDRPADLTACVRVRTQDVRMLGDGDECGKWGLDRVLGLNSYGATFGSSGAAARRRASEVQIIPMHLLFCCSAVRNASTWSALII